MKYKIVIILIALLLLVAACQAGLSPTLTSSPTATATPSPTATATPTLTPTPTFTPTPPPATWQILFTGFPCEGRTMCVPFDDTRFSYHSINSDGNGLKQLQESSFPPTPSLPEGSPPPEVFNSSPPQISPDGSLLVYVSDDGGLYIADRESGETTHLFRPENIPDTISNVGPNCWAPNGLTIRFVIGHRRGNEHLPEIFYAIDLDGGNLQPLFTVTGLGGPIWFGDCSPDGRELAFSVPESSIEGKAGLYIVNLDSGEWRQILTDYYVWKVRTVSTTTETLR